MRKFRAWHKKNKEMVYFNPSKKDRYIASFFYELVHDECAQGELMQFTGMIDMEGREIYEGDILDFNEAEWGEKFTPESVPKLTEFVGEFPMCGTKGDVSQWRRVIGNIYESGALVI